MQTYIIRRFPCNRDALGLRVSPVTPLPPIRVTVNRLGRSVHEWVFGGGALCESDLRVVNERFPVAEIWKPR